MSAEDFDADPFEVWPENWPVVRLFCRMNDQWRVGLNGPSGMDYSLALSLMDRMSLDGEAWDRMLDDLQTMAHAALDEMRKED